MALCFTLLMSICLCSSCVNDLFTLTYEAEVGTCARVCESLINSTKGIEMCIT